ncbi:hypothetical protein V6N11_054112 [Hibiscus sabdariffa]|uniref:PIR2-like helical domain-containing protein n=1 Tax=Hibiscus sabdariffa TaxID=183260 RepID=A0ABR2S3L0_9ROSI
MEEYSLAGMIRFLQQVMPHLSKGDAIWCLLVSDLHVDKASRTEIPSLPSPTNGCNLVSHNLERVDNNGKMTLQRNIEFPKRFNLSPSMESLLKKNVAIFAASFRGIQNKCKHKIRSCLISLLHQIKDLEKQVKEKKDWRLDSPKGKHTIEDSTMKRLPEMESALSLVDRTNAAVRQLETENAETKAEMEPSGGI